MSSKNLCFGDRSALAFENRNLKTINEKCSVGLDPAYESRFYSRKNLICLPGELR